MADLAALEGAYPRAVENYEKVAQMAVNNNLMKWSVKDYFLKAGICNLASQVRSELPFLHSIRLFLLLSRLAPFCDHTPHASCP